MLSQNLLYPVAALVIVEAARMSAMFTAFQWIHHHQVPTLFLLTLVFIVAAGACAAVEGPWKDFKNLRPKQYIRVSIYAAVFFLNVWLFFNGLKYAGPIKTVLSSDFSDTAVVMFFRSLRSKGSLGKLKGIAVLALGYFISLWVDSPPIDFPSGSDEINGTAFKFWVLDVSDSQVGSVVLILGVLLSAFRKNLSRIVGPVVGGPTKLYSLSLMIIAFTLVPCSLLSILWDSSELWKFADISESYGGIGSFLSLFQIALFILVLHFYVQAFAHPRISTSSTAKISLTTSFIAALLCEWWWDVPSIGGATVISFVLIALGLHLVLQQRGKSEKLPVYSATFPSARRSVMANLARTVLRNVMEDKETRSIFIFFVINIAYMVVEMLYGIWTNSLGLLTDAFHMLFDCTALIVGLAAAVIAKWESNRLFSYGYGRVEVLSGFINGIFLVFIAISIVVEAIERFYDPPEIDTDRLLMVSVGGLLVNLIGVFAFHDAAHGHSHGGGHTHGHSHSGGHSHGHSHGGGHSHGHSHGGGHDHAHKKKKKKHGHTHEHAHKHAHDKPSTHGHAHHSADNMIGVYIHVLADTLGSVGVIISTLLIHYFGWYISDSIVSFCIAILIVSSVIPLIKSTAATLLQRTPRSMEHELSNIGSKILSLEGVLGYSQPHLWKNDDNLVVGTVQVQIADDCNEQVILRALKAIFKSSGVHDVTTQIEKSPFGR